LAEPAPLLFLERPPAGEPGGLLVLHHGRGTDERDLLPLADALDPQQRWHVVSPRAPLQPPGSAGYHWYLVPRVGTPDPATFFAARAALAAFHDELWQRTGIEPARTVLGGFSMGAVMSYVMGLDPERPVPAGILAFSGFIPSVEGWEPDISGRARLPVLIAHGRRDPVIDIGFGRAAAERLSAGGLAIEYHESDAAHGIDGAALGAAAPWLAGRLAGSHAPGTGAEERGSA
jgi:phospholipase/carboxylesterase